MAKEIKVEEIKEDVPVRGTNLDLLELYMTGKKKVESKYIIDDDKIYALNSGDVRIYDDTLLLAVKFGKYILVSGNEDENTDNDSFTDGQYELQCNGAITTSFECIKMAGLDINDVKILDASKDYIKTARPDQKDFANFGDKMIQGATYHEFKHTNGKVYQKRWHRAGCVLLEHDNFYYICGQDEDSYFISKLRGEHKTVANAFKSLKPKEVLDWERKNKKVALRQGEWFFIPCPDLEADNMISYEPLPHEEEGNPHKAEYYEMSNMGKHYVKGCISHPEHRTLYLGDGKVLYEAICNTALGSWSVQGVD